MRKLQVNALIEHAEKDLDSISSQYKKALEEQIISIELQIDIKNYMENLRSALDYIAHDIYEKHIAPRRMLEGKPEIENVYFPYGQTENDFKSSIGSNLPQLESISLDLYNIIEEKQFFKINDNWLYEFCSTLNEKKHDRLTPQKIEEKRGLKINFGDGASIQMGPGASISGGGFIGTSSGGIHLQGDTISGDSPAKKTTGSVNQTIIRWISFEFSDTHIEVQPLLKKAMSGIKDISTSIYNKI